jgi:hypothetical protein
VGEFLVDTIDGDGSSIRLYLIGIHLTDFVRSFLGQCTLIVVAVLLVLWKIPSSTPTEGSIKHSAAHPVTSYKVARVDFAGAGLLASSITAFLLLLDLGGKSRWNSPPIYALGGTSIALCGPPSS